MNNNDVLNWANSFKAKSYNEKLNKIGLLFGVVKKEDETDIEFRDRVIYAVGDGYVRGLILALDIES